MTSVIVRKSSRKNSVMQKQRSLVNKTGPQGPVFRCYSAASETTSFPEPFNTNPSDYIAFTASAGVPEGATMIDIKQKRRIK